MNRDEIADLIVQRLKKEKLIKLKEKYKNNHPLNYLIVEDLLPIEVACELDRQFPLKNNLKLRSETQEKKYIALK